MIKLKFNKSIKGINRQLYRPTNKTPPIKRNILILRPGENDADHMIECVLGYRMGPNTKTLKARLKSMGTGIHEANGTTTNLDF